MLRFLRLLVCLNTVLLQPRTISVGATHNGIYLHCCLYLTAWKTATLSPQYIKRICTVLSLCHTMPTIRVY